MLRRLVRPAAAIAALTLALAGCGDVGNPRVAATVNGEAIPRSTLESRFQIVASNPQVAQQLRSDGSGQLRGRVQAQILTELVAATLVRQGAVELGVEIDEDDLAAQRDQLAQQVGGEEALQRAISQQGLSDAQLRQLLRDRAYRQAISAALAGEDAAGQQASQAFAEWLAQRRDQARIDVNPEFGRWDARSGSVVAEIQDADAAASGQPGAPASAGSQPGTGQSRGDASTGSRAPGEEAGS